MNIPENPTVLITGAGGGMCRGINAKFAAAGYHVVAVDLTQELADRAAAAVREAGGTATGFAVDVSDEDSVATLHQQVREAVGPVHVLVNAAGILDRKFLADHTAKSFRFALDVNLVGPFLLIKEFAPDMLKADWGRIINIASMAGTTGYPYPSYAASKAGLSNLSRSLLEDFWGTGITVNNICPGVVDTPMVIDEVRAQVRRRVPTQKIVTPEEIGALATFLAGEDAKNINGANLLIDGGATQLFSLFNNHDDA